MLLLFHLICLLILANDSNAIKIEVYYDTRCKYSRKAIQNSVQMKKDFGDLIEVQVYPVENRNNEWRNFFTCDYKPSADELKVHICLADNKTLSTPYLETIDCLMGSANDSNSDWFNSFRNCSGNKMTQLEIAAVEHCYLKDASDLLNHLRGEIVQMGFNFYPLIDVNQKFKYDILVQGVLLRNMKAIVCEEFPKSKIPKICNNVVHSCGFLI